MNFESVGGSLFAADPCKSFNEQTVFWAPEVLPTVLRIRDVNPQADTRPGTSLDIENAELRRAADGWHAVLQLEGATHRLWLPRLPKHSTFVVELPLDADLPLRTQSATRLWSTLQQRSSKPPYHDFSAHVRERLALTIRALDGHSDGNSYRAIAEVLFGRASVTERAWRTHDLRSRTIRLVKNGIALMRGGYRALLHLPHRKK